MALGSYLQFQANFQIAQKETSSGESIWLCSDGYLYSSDIQTLSIENEKL